MPEQRNIHYCNDDAESSGEGIGSFKYRLPGPNRDVAQYTVCLWYEFLDCSVGNESNNLLYHS